MAEWGGNSPQSEFFSDASGSSDRKDRI